MTYMKDIARLVCLLTLGTASLPIAFAQAPDQAAGGGPLVSISTGQLRGSVSPDGGAVFKNIPFAQPPVGDLRWREPLPAKAWTGVRDATSFGPMCHQNDNKQLPHSEDCLQLNVWTPQVSPSTSPCPSWSGSTVAETSPDREWKRLFNGEVLARHGVVVVNINYRLGVFGFFAHPELTKESPHHAAGKLRAGRSDSGPALGAGEHRQVRRQPANVTIFGESAGASDVNALIASPLTKGLFVRVIAQSGPDRHSVVPGRFGKERRRSCGPSWASPVTHALANCARFPTRS